MSAPDDSGPDAPPGFFWIGGTLAGATGTVALVDNGTDHLSLAANGSFMFATPIRDGQVYDVMVSGSPAGESCTLGNASGTVAGADVVDIYITCFVPGTDPGILCSAGQYCTAGSQFCCLKQGGNGACHALTVACSTSPLDCDDAADCPPAQLCCAGYDPMLQDWSSTCQAACSFPPSFTSEIWCDPMVPSGACPGAMTCSGSSQLAGRHICQ